MFQLGWAVWFGINRVVEICRDLVILTVLTLKAVNSTQQTLQCTVSLKSHTLNLQP